MEKTKKRNAVLTAFTVFCSLLLLSFSTVNRTYQNECVSVETDGYITHKIWDTKAGANYKPEQARKDAIHTILYAGIRGGKGCLTQPPILNKSEQQKKFEKIEESFFARNGKWSALTRSSAIETTLPTTLGAKKWKVYQVSISKNELRKYLEEQKIINSLNTAF